MLGFCSLAAAQEVMVKLRLTVTIPDTTPAGAVVCITGSTPELGNWDPGKIKLFKVKDGWSATIKVPRDTPLEFKFTRGNWRTVEKDADGQEIQNRTLTLSKDSDIALRVPRWADTGEKQVTRSTDVIEHSAFRSRTLKNTRSLYVWIPPGYEEDRLRKYPVLYMQDGQNLFDDMTAQNKEWKLDESARALVESNVINRLIIVGIGSTPDRIAEYTPDADPKLGGGNSAKYAQFVVEEVKPFIDRRYRTLPEPENTCVGGSGLGALAALNMLQTCPRAFAGAIVMSPTLSWNDRTYLKSIEKDSKFLKGKHLWIDVGLAEGDDADQSKAIVDDLHRLQKCLEKSGLKKDREFGVIEADGATADEAAWSQRINDAMKFLFAAQ